MAEAEVDALPDAEEPQPDTAQLSGPDQPNGELPQLGTCKTAVGRSRAHHMTDIRSFGKEHFDIDWNKYAPCLVCFQVAQNKAGPGRRGDGLARRQSGSSSDGTIH